MSPDLMAIIGSLYHMAMITKAKMLRNRTLGIILIDRVHAGRD